MNVDAIPSTLRSAQSWLLWRREGQHKTPYSAKTGRKVDPTDPAGWATFAAALAAQQRTGADGIGLALCGADALVAFDLDHALDDAGAPTPWARILVDDLRSYTEVSPSGRGLRIFVIADKTGYTLNKVVHPVKGGGKVEVFMKKSYVTVTGEVFGERRDVMIRTAQVAKWVARWQPPPTTPARKGSAPTANDAELLRKMFASSAGQRIRRLWDGDCSDYGGDASRADWQLVRDLLFWTGGDADRTDRLFRQSLLYRPKWDERHTGDGCSYGWLTISKVLATNPAIYAGRR